MNDDLTQAQAESIVFKIKKLMALSKSSNENEAASAAAKAQELLLKYNVELSQVENVSLDREDTRLVSEFKELFGLNVIQWKRDLAFSVAKANMCKGVSSGRGMYFLGKKHNIEIVEFLYETIVRDLERIAEEKWKQILALRDMQSQFPQLNLFTDYSLMHVHGKTWKASFYVGAVKTVKERLEENLTELQVDNPNLSALITTEDVRLQNFFRQQFPSTTKVHGASASYRAAYESGRIAGREVQFKRGVGAGGIHTGPHALGDGKGNSR